MTGKITESQSDSTTFPDTRNITVGLARSTRNTEQSNDIGLQVSRLSQTSVMVGFERSLANNRFILSGSSITTLTKQSQLQIAKDITKTPQYTNMQQMCQELNIQLRGKNTLFTAQYGIQRNKNQEFPLNNTTLQTLGLSAKYSRKNFDIAVSAKAGSTPETSNLQLSQIRSDVSYYLDRQSNALFRASLIYDAVNKQFSPKFSLITPLSSK